MLNFPIPWLLLCIDNSLPGAHNLIQLCLKVKRPAPANFNFCSSVSAVAATKGGHVPEGLPAEFSYAQGIGYARSKLVTCSALREEYRADLREMNEDGVQVTFFVLQAGLETLKTRVTERVGHYMKVEMVQGQVAILEEPGVRETDIIPVDVGGARGIVQREVDALFEDVTGRKARSWQVQV